VTVGWVFGWWDAEFAIDTCNESEGVLTRGMAGHMGWREGRQEWLFTAVG
jgi:hypothetical protein